MDVLYSDDVEAIRQYLSTSDGITKINNRDGNTATPLYWACEHNRNDVVDVLIEYKADVNLSCFLGKVTPLYTSCGKGYIDIVSRLLTAGADPNIGNHTGRLPIMEAVGYHHLDIVKLLTIYTNFNAVDDNDATIFMYAVSLGNNEMVDYVLDYYTNINHVDNNGNSCLHMAVKWGNKYAIKFLLSKRIDVDIENCYNKKACDYTTDPEIFALLALNSQQ